MLVTHSTQDDPLPCITLVEGTPVKLAKTALYFILQEVILHCKLDIQ